MGIMEEQGVLTRGDPLYSYLPRITPSFLHAELLQEWCAGCWAMYTSFLSAVPYAYVGAV